MRFLSSPALGCSDKLAGLPDAFLRRHLQIAVYKGDIRQSLNVPIFLLTYVEKPIIINSFHRGRGAGIFGRAFVFTRESPGRFLGIK